MPKLPGYTAPPSTAVVRADEAVSHQPSAVSPTLTADSRQLTATSEIVALGRLMADSGFFPDARKEAEACVKILAGRELGIGPVAAMTGIYVIRGRITHSANLMAALIKRSPRYDYRVEELTPTQCAIAFYERGEKIGVSVYTIEDAKAAGVAQGENWKKYPRNMLFARAISNGVRFYCPDVSATPLYTPEELGSTTAAETGEYIETEVTVEPI